MKLISKIYLGIGFILLIFSIVTVTYLYHAAKVEQNIKNLLISTDLLRYSEAQQKSLIDMETGFRGFLITENEAFLEPYYAGLSQIIAQEKILLQLADDDQERKYIYQLREAGLKWTEGYAEIVIDAKRKALQHHIHKAAFDSIYEVKVKTASGKHAMDTIRRKFEEFDTYENNLKQNQQAALHRSLNLTRNISISLTLLAIIIAVITALVLTGNVRRRLSEMIRLADNVASGNFKVNIRDTSGDEMAHLSTSLSRMAIRLNQYFNNLTKANKELDQFAYVVSHDLKAPLRAINNLAEWLAEDITDPDPQIQKNLQLMRGRVHRMENLINGILEYSKVGRKKVAAETVNVKKLLEDITDSLAPPPHITVTLPAKTPTLFTEKIFLQQVFANLISNGIKYNNKAEGRIDVSVKPAGAFYEFTVRDNGPGIPAQFHDKVFGIFQTMEARDTVESTGVGLAIVKKIIDEKGATIRIDSQENEYTAFIFTWPAA